MIKTRSYKLGSSTALRMQPPLEPEEEPEGPECEQCGAEMTATIDGKLTGYYWVKAVCPECQHSFEHDNLD